MGLSSIILPIIQSFNDPKGLILNICSKENRKIADRVTTMLWMLWNNMNNLIWNNEKLETNQLGI